MQVLLWEIAAQEQPDLLSVLNIIGGAYTIQLSSKLEEGLRWPVDPRWPAWVKQVTAETWHKDPTARPSFEVICKRLKAEVQQTSETSL